MGRYSRYHIAQLFVESFNFLNRSMIVRGVAADNNRFRVTTEGSNQDAFVHLFDGRE